jgi:hypothetical protein
MGCLVRLVLVLAVLLGLAAVADAVVRSRAEREAEERLSSAEEISGPIDVEIHGFPFLLQLARNRFTDVDISGGQVGNGQLRLTRFDASLHGVRPESDGSSARVDAMDGSAFVSYADLQQAVGRPGITVAEGGDQRIRVAGSITVLGQTLSASAQSKVSVLDGNQLMVQATEIDVPGLPTNSEVARAAAARLNFVVPVRGLPEGLRLVDVRVGDEGVTALVQGQDVLLRGQPATAGQG